MRQRFQNDEQTQPQQMAYRVPQAAEATAAVAPVATTAAPLKRVQKKRAATTKRFRPARVLLGFLAFLFLPWFPPSTATKPVIPRGETANAVFNDAEKLLNLPKPGKRVSQMSAAEYKAQMRQYDQTDGTKGTALPARYTDPSEELKTVEAMQASVTKGKAALALLPKALSLPYSQLGLDDHRPKNSLAISELARLRTREGILEAIHGNHAAAVEAYLDTIALGVKIGKGGGTTTGVVGEIYVGMGLRELDDSIAQLTPEQAQRAAERLESLLQQRTTLEQLLVVERDQTVALFKNMASAQQAGFLTRIPLYRAAHQYIVGTYQGAMDEKIALLRQSTAPTPASLENHFASYDPRDAYIPNLRRIYENYTQRTERAEALLKLLKARAEGK